MLELGVSIGGMTVLALRLLTRILRQPVPPRWIQSNAVAEVAAVALVAGFALGIVLIGAGLVELMETGVSMLDLGLLAGVALLLVVAWRLLGRRRIRPGAGRLPTGTA